MKLLALSIFMVVPMLAQTPVAECRKHRFYGRLDQAKSCFEKLSFSNDPYQRAEALWYLGNFQQANESFKAAVAQQPKNADYRVRWGRLFLERSQHADAIKLFAEALEIKPDYAPALIGMAMIAGENFDGKAVEHAEKALKADPKSVEAQQLLAKLALEDTSIERAAKEADKALGMSAEALDAMAVMATIEVLADRSPQQWFDRIAKVNPAYGEAEAYLAHVLILNRRYEEAIEYFKKALAKNNELWDAHSELGITYMRLAREKEARTHLEKAYDNNFKDAATVNSLRLMDSYKNFVTVEGKRGVSVRLQRREADLLKLYFLPELEKAVAGLEKKYKVTLKYPVQLEVYPDHEDFAVRTLGMPGLGALGVTFGYVVAMDSPSGRKPGSFHWASTLWHELSHVFVLSATNHRVPRWFTEGLAVHEETAVAPDWGDRLDPTVLAAIKDKKLLPVAELDRGFMRPTYPNQVIVSYFQAGRICDYIAGKWGFQKLLDIMNAFAKNAPTAQVIEQQLGMKPEAFDTEFQAWLLKQIATPLDKYQEWTKRLRPMMSMAKEKRWDDVIKEGREIRDWFPEYVDPGNVYEMLADAYLAKGDKQAGVKELEAWAKTGGRYPATLKKLADLQVELGRPKDAIATLEKLNFIYPVLDPEMHAKLGDLHLAHGNPRVAVREFQATIASKPTDKAAAHYHLAQAYYKLNNVDQAQEEVLNALEQAPGYKPAQKLLLELNALNRDREGAATKKKD